MVISPPKRKIPMCAYDPFTFVLSENVFCAGMVLLNPVCVLLSGMLHVYKSDVHCKCCSFRDLMTSARTCIVQPKNNVRARSGARRTRTHVLLWRLL